NLFNPSFMFCYLILKRRSFRVRLFYILAGTLVVQMATIPLMYYSFSAINANLVGPQKAALYVTQYHFRGRRYLRFKLFVNNYLEWICSRRRPGLTIGPFGVITKIKSVRVSNGDLLCNGHFGYYFGKY